MNETLLKVICELVSEKDDTRIVRGLVKTHNLEIGKSYLIRTVTMMYTGRVISITDFDIKLEDAAWIADSGRYSVALETGTLNEVEPYPNGCFVARQGIIDFAPWDHNLPRDMK